MNVLDLLGIKKRSGTINDSERDIIVVHESENVWKIEYADGT